MRRGKRIALLVWPVCGALTACSTDQRLGTAAGDAGAGGEARGSGGHTDEGTAGSPSDATGGRSHNTGGVGGGRTTGQAGQGTGGRVDGTGGADGGTDAAQAGQATGGRTEGTGGRTEGTGGRTEGTGGATGGRGATGGQAGQGTGGGAPSEGLPGASSFSKLTVRESDAMAMTYPPTSEDECALSGSDAYEHVWVVDRSSRTLSWDRCRYYPPYKVDRGSGTLSDAEFQGVLNALSVVVPSTRYRCGFDGPLMKLELEVDGSSILYTDDFYKCDNDPTNYVQELYHLVSWLGTLSGALEMPATPVLDVYTDDPLDEVPPSASECTAHYVPHFQLDLSTGDFSWDYCTTPAESGDFTLVTGSRVLEAAELASVLRAYGELELGASGPCASLSIPTSEYAEEVRVAYDDSYLYLVDEGFSCDPESGQGYAIGIAELVRVVEGLDR
ncbi:MAG: hypothetical protein JW940_03355 [Polyangiaceae bacterium]|nr:hypothetical protein [Polyangiaceae bacterium]